MANKIRKKIVDKIRKMTQEGYAKVEIMEKLKVSRPTVMKYSEGVKVKTSPQESTESQQVPEELRQRVEQLEKAISTSLALSRLPTRCDNGHPLLFALRCIDPECPKHGEYWATLEGTVPYGTKSLGHLLELQNNYFRWGIVQSEFMDASDTYPDIILGESYKASDKAVADE